MTFFFSLLKTSIRSSMSLRGAFLIEAGLMIANNLIYFTLWWLFFRYFNDIDGWKLPDLAALVAIGSGAYGLMQICFGGVKNLSRAIVNGDLDPFMIQPKNLLIHLISSRSYAKGWGHLMTAVILVALTRLYTYPSILIIVISILSGCLVFTAITVMAHSLAFWLGSIESVSRKYCDSLYLFSNYPSNIYSGVLQLVMFTVIPAGVIGYLPVELLRSFSWLKFGILLGSSLCFFGLAFLVFYRGLKQYESGNQFGMRL